MKIGLKLILGFLTISIIGGLVGYMGFSGSQGIIKTYNVIADETAPEIVVLGKIGLLSQQLQSATVSFVLINAELSVSGESAIAVVEELKEFEETNEKLDEAILEFGQLGKVEVFEEIKEAKTGLYNTALDLIEAKKEGKMGQPIFSLKEKLEESGKDFEDIINGYIAEGEKKLVTQGTIADKLATNTTNLILIVSIGGIILAISLGVFISRLISSPVKNLEMAAKEMTKGNFDVELKSTSNDEIGEFAKLFGSMAKAIKQVDRQKEEFSSMVTHELRTPLMPILSWSSALNQVKILGKLTPDQSRAVNKIAANAKKLRTLIDDLLDAQKLELKKMKFDHADIHISDFMNDIFKDTITLTEQKKIQLVNSTKENFVFKSDKGRLEQVLSNLIFNAVDFVPKNTGKIEINAQSNDSQVLFYVKDNGPGVSPENQNSLFKKFYQIDTSLTRKHGGSGLGLSICKGIVEGLGGRIWIESEVEKGTTFYFEIPKEKKN